MRRKIALELVLGEDLGGDPALHGPARDLGESGHHLIHLGKDGGGSNGGRGFREGSGCERQYGNEQSAEHFGHLRTPPAYHAVGCGSATQCRVITTLRQPALPAASMARTVTELFPTRSGIDA